MQRVARSKTKRDGPAAVTKDEAHDHFKRTVADSKWAALRGYHVLRHSVISALASEGVDQWVIDEVVGHQSEEQRKRYRHLCPRVMFVWWKNGRSRVDIDLSAAMYDRDYRYRDTLVYYNLRNFGAHHSGDITDAPKGAAEFIDIDLSRCELRGDLGRHRAGE